jgi:hypothetical protein
MLQHFRGRSWTEKEEDVMFNRHQKWMSYVAFVPLFALAVLISGCALGVTRVNVTHNPIAPVANKRQGTILVKTFQDKRPDTQYIGHKRNGYGMALGHIGTQEGVKLDVLLTQYFADALKEAGYDVIIEQPGAAAAPEGRRIDAIVQGDILTFWLDLYLMTWHKVNVLVKALDRTGQTVVWQKEISAKETNPLWVGIVPEFEKVIRDALTKALNQAAQEFASEEFYSSVKK